MQLTATDDRVILSRFYDIVSADREWVSDEFAEIVKFLRPRDIATAMVPRSDLPRDARVEKGDQSTLDVGDGEQRNGIARVRSPPMAQPSW